MTEQNLCPRPGCDRPIHDTAYVCPRSADELANLLRTVAKTAGEAEATIARLAKQGDGSSGDRLPYDPTAAVVLDEAVSTLVTWARHIDQSGGDPLPIVWRGEHPLAVLALWLAGDRKQKRLTWLRYRPEADEAFDEIEDACRRLIRLVDRPPDRWYAGPCGICGEQLNPVAGAKTIRCPGCEATWDADERKAWLLEQIDDQEATAGAAAVALTALGVKVTPERVRQWAHRNQLLPRRTVGGQKLYRISDVRTLVIEAAHRDLDRRIRRAKRDAESRPTEAEEALVA